MSRSKIVGIAPLTQTDGTLYEARVSDDGEILTTETERERNVFARVFKSGIAATARFVLVDLSDAGGYGAAGFQYDQTGRIDITILDVNIDRDSTATGTIKIGVVTAITATAANLTWIKVVPFEKSAEQRITSVTNYAPSQVKAGVSGGIATHLVCNDKETGNTGFQNDTALESATGANVIPAVGDIVIEAVRTAGTYDLSVMISYHAQETA